MWSSGRKCSWSNFVYYLHCRLTIMWSNMHRNPEIAANILRRHLESLEKWLKLWRIQVNETKSFHISFALEKTQCATMYLNGTAISQTNEVK